MAFTFIPLISAAIFYASNGSTKISFLDSLFMCTSAMTSSGLNTINLSTTTVWQQVILAFLMFIGNSTSVSLLVLLVRRSYFKSRCEEAVRMARQQRHERDLIRDAVSAGRAGTGMFGRIRTRAQTILGWEPTPIIQITPEAREDGLGTQGDVSNSPEVQTKGRVRGGTITTHTTQDAIGSDDTHIMPEPTFGNGAGGEKAGNGSGKMLADGSSGADGEHQPERNTEVVDGNNNTRVNGRSFIPPTFIQTAPTPSSTLLPDLGTTDSPADERAHPTDDRNVGAVSDGRSRLRPRPLAVGHESDRNIRSMGDRPEGIWAGDNALVESESPEGIRGSTAGQALDVSDGRSSDVDNAWNPRKSVGAESAQHDLSPTSPKSANGSAQFVTSNLSPRDASFASSPKAMSEFAPPSPGGTSLPPVLEQEQASSDPDPHRSPAPEYQALSPSDFPMPPRRGTISSAGSRGPTYSPVVRPPFLHAPTVVPRARRTTFVDQAPPSHPNGNGRNRGNTFNGESQRRAATARARNGTITSPMPPQSHLPPHGGHHVPTHMEGDMKFPPNNGTELRPNNGEYPHNGAGHGHFLHPHHLHPPVRRTRAQTGSGGLPGPLDLAQWGLGHVPAVKKFAGEHEREVVQETEGHNHNNRRESYMRTDSIRSSGAGRNHIPAPDVDDISLEEEDLQKLGGDEYNALVVLSWIVAGHYFLYHAIAFTILAPYSAKVSLVRDVIDAQNESSGRNLNPTWFALFTVISAYANAGLTVVDTSLTQMSSAYLVIFVIIWLILVGATAFPLSLRFSIWVGTKIFKHGSTAKGLRFLLRHPRRCFMYLFPSHQSWYLLFTLVVIFLLDWVAYLTFNIDMPGIDSIPTGPRVVGGFLQAVGQRAGGFTTINLQAIAPALQVVYIATMFVQVYPIAMAVRTSNVYEESGVVIYQPEEDDEEPDRAKGGESVGFTAYLGWHVKHQLAQDLFWLIAALTTLCAFERKRILAEETAYFNIFSLFFEITSAFANVGFSLGVSSQPFSLSGEMRSIPKLVIIGLMIRGRHRGLPMAIDRAVLLPTEYKTTSSVTPPSGVSSRRSTGVPASRRPTIGTWTRTSVRQRQRAQDPTLDSDSE